MALAASIPQNAIVAKYLPVLLEQGLEKVPASHRKATVAYAMSLLADPVTGFWWFWLNLAWIRVKGDGKKAGWQRACPGGKPRINENGRGWEWQAEISKLLTIYDTLLILKARQIGFTYLLANLVVWAAIHSPNGAGIAVIANKTQTAKRLMQRSLQTYNRLPQWLKDEVPMLNPAISRMVFANGSIVEPYSGDPDAARSDDATWVFVDEVGELERLDDFYASIESIADDGGHLILCGTAKNNGLEGYVRDSAEGDTVAEAVVELECGETMHLPVTLGENNMHFLFVPDRVHPNRTDEWRAKKIRSFKGNLRNFEREHPQTWQEAFIAQGGGYFDSKALASALYVCRDLFEARDQRGHLVAARDNPYDVKFVPDAYGHVVRHATEEEFHALMEMRRPFAIGVDSAGNRDGGDAHAASALMQGVVPLLDKDFDPDTFTPHIQLFTIHGRFDADEYGQQCVNLGHLLGDAIMGIETNGVGVAVMQTVRRLHYPSIYRRRTSEKKMGSAITTEYGWWSNAETKQLAYGELERCLRNGYTDIRDYSTLLEMGNVLMLGTSANGIGAKTPKHDDRPDGLSIAHAIVHKCHAFGVRSANQSVASSPWGTAEWLEEQFKAQDLARNPKTVIGNENRSILR